jgi:hypothetical protein
MMALVWIGTPALIAAAVLPGGVRLVGTVAAAVLTIAVFIRGLGVALDINDVGLRVRNFRRTVSIPWDQVVRIGLAGRLGPSKYGINSCLAVEVRNGTRVKCLATMAPGKAQARRISLALGRAGELHGVSVGLGDWQ